MPSRDLLLRILGDSSSAERALRNTGTESHKLGGHFSSLGKLAAISAGAVGVGLLVEGMKSSVEAAMSAQASQAALDQALRATHQSVTKMSPVLEDAAKKSRDLGFSDIDTEQAMTRLELATGNTKLSIQDLSVAQDIARVKHTDLTSASQMLAQAMTGSQRAAKQLGIVVSAVTTNVDKLKASHEDLTTATGKEDLAHAKLMDKMATGKSVIEAVTEKVHGQADVYASTAAGSMARFHASMENLQVIIGTKLIPVLTFLVNELVTVVNYIEAHWPQISAVFNQVMNAVLTAWNSVGKPAFDAVLTFSRTAINYVEEHWPEISRTVKTVMDDIRIIVKGVIDVVEALWRAFGGTIETIARNDLGAVAGVFRGLVTEIRGVFNLIDDLIHGRWSQLWGDAKQIVSGAMAALEAVLTAAVKNVGAIALLIGSALKNGIVGALEGIGGIISAVIRGAINEVIDAIDSIHIHIPSVSILGHKIGGGDIGFNIPHLAQGGIVNGPTLALIGESGPEAVVPLNRSGGFGGDLHIHGGTFIGTSLEAVADELHALLLRKQQSTRLGFTS